MDDLLSQLKTTGLSHDDEENRSGYEGLYKNWGKLGHQDQRRKDMLDDQRNNRNSKVDTCRNILNIVNNSWLMEPKEEPQKSFSKYRPTIYVAGFTQASTNYKDVLMMSEWLIERPADFADNWFVIPCPKGVRTLLVATQGSTKLYSKYGSFRLSTHTALPGGHPGDYKSNELCVILDCFYVETTKKLYVLDLLAWNTVTMSDGETEFRHYWMKTHIEDIPELRTFTARNKLVFEVLPKVDCDRHTFNRFMMTMPHFRNFQPTMDGLLFYHKFAHYVSGVTPLVGWLYPFMVNEVLGSDITVNPGYLVERPIGYTDQAHYIQEFELKMKKRLPGFAKSSSSMDTSAEGEQNDDQQKGRQRKQKSRRNNDSEMVESIQLKRWQPTAMSFESWTLPADTIKPRLTKIRPFVEGME